MKCRDWIKTQDTRDAPTLANRALAPGPQIGTTPTGTIEQQRPAEQVANERQWLALSIADRRPTELAFKIAGVDLGEITGRVTVTVATGGEPIYDDSLAVKNGWTQLIKARYASEAIMRLQANKEDW